MGRREGWESTLEPDCEGCWDKVFELPSLDVEGEIVKKCFEKTYC